MTIVEDTPTNQAPPTPEALIPEAREVHRRRRRRRWAAVIVGLLLLGGGGYALFGAGSDTVLGGHGPLPAGISDSRVASPLSVHLVSAPGYCLHLSQNETTKSGEAVASFLGLYLPCYGRAVATCCSSGGAQHGTLVVLSWTARQPVTSKQMAYDLSVDSRCGGGGAGVTGRITAGMRLTRGIIVKGCASPYTGFVAYNPNISGRRARWLPPAFFLSRELNRGALPNGWLLVGSFTINIPRHGKHP